jgi:type I restriction enzyme S subunit
MKTKLQTQNKEEYKETELGLLPKDWGVVRLGNKDYFEILPSGIEEFKGKKEYLSTESIQLNKVMKIECSIDFKNRPSRANMQPLINSVWFAKMKNTIKVYSFDEKNRDEIQRYILSTGFCGVLCKQKINPTFLKMIFISDYFNKLKDSLAHGTTQQAVNTEDIKSINLPLPPLPEQQKIAYVLSTVQNAKEKTERLVTSLKELKKSTMKHLFTYGAVSFEDKDKVKLKETEIGNVPKEWAVVKFENVCERLIGGGTPSTSKPQYWGGNIDWTTSKRLDGNKIFLFDGEKKITSEGLKNSSTNLIPKNNLIISTRVTVGKIAINKIDLAISQDLTGAIIDPKKYVLEFLAYQLSTEKIQSIFQNKKRGATIKGITRNDLKVFDIVLPSFPEQQQIASTLSSIDKKIEVEEQKKEALEQLFKSLLHNLMSGKIRVNDLKIEVRE